MTVAGSWTSGVVPAALVTIAPVRARVTMRFAGTETPPMVWAVPGCAAVALALPPPTLMLPMLPSASRTRSVAVVGAATASLKTSVTVSPE